MACQAVPLGDVKIEIPPDSLTAQQRLSIEGVEVPVQIAPAVAAVDVTIPPPTLHDLRADAARLRDALSSQGIGRPTFPLAVLKGLSEQLRNQGWQARLAIRDPPARARARRAEVAAVLAPGSSLLGLAVDIGTTKLAAYLVDLASGQTVARAGAMNPQIAYGEDVISRIGYCSEHPDGRSLLQARLVETLNGFVTESAGRSARTGSRSWMRLPSATQPCIISSPGCRWRSWLVRRTWRRSATRWTCGCATWDWGWPPAPTCISRPTSPVLSAPITWRWRWRQEPGRQIALWSHWTSARIQK